MNDTSNYGCLQQPGSDANTTPAETATQLIFEAFVRQYHIEMPRDQFVGVCAYLYTICELGYRIQPHEIDHFVRRYPDFRRVLDSVEAERMSTTSIPVPAYHQWFLKQEREVGVGPGSHVLDGSSIQKIMEEHPYAYLHTKLSMEDIVYRKGQEQWCEQEQCGSKSSVGV